MEKKFEFTPKQWVLVRYKRKYGSNKSAITWTLNIFSHFEESEGETYLFCVAGIYRMSDAEVIPFEGNEAFCGTADNPTPVINPKDGDFLISSHGYPFICKIIGKKDFFGAYLGIDTTNQLTRGSDGSKWTNKTGCRYATEEEKQQFLDRIHDEIKEDWDAESKTFMDYRDFNPKDGDFVVIQKASTQWTFVGIFKSISADGYISLYAYGPILDHSDYPPYGIQSCEANDDHLELNNECILQRYATDEEKKTFLSRLCNERKKEWDEENKIFEKIWKPEEGEGCFFIEFSPFLGEFCATVDIWHASEEQVVAYNLRRVFSKKCGKKANIRAKRLNEAIKGTL